MSIQEILSKYDLEKARLSVGFVNAEVSFGEADRNAAWDLYVEMLTRIVAHPLPRSAGDEQAALDSVCLLFPTVWGILRRRGREATGFRKISVLVLNQVVRPFTTKWREHSLSGAFDGESGREAFRRERESLQVDLRNYNRMLAMIAEVDDLTDMSSGQRSE